MRIIDNNNNQIYILADRRKVIVHNSFWGIGLSINSEELKNVKEISDSDLCEYLKQRDKQLCG